MTEPESGGKPPEDASYTAFYTARTPVEAELVRALLQGAGIHAHVEGSLLADEYAVSQRSMNTLGVRVFVRADQHEEARRVLAESRVPDDELERQALEAAPPPGEEGVVPRAPSLRPRSPRLLAALLLVSVAAAVVFMFLWQQERSRGPTEDPLLVYEALPDGILARWKHNGREAYRQFDRDHDGVFEEVRHFDRNGRLILESYDRDGNGLFERLVEHQRDGSRYEWTDEDGDGVLDRVLVRDASGRATREYRVAGADGFVRAR